MLLVVGYIVSGSIVNVIGKVVHSHGSLLIQCTVSGRYKNDANGLDITC